VRNRSKVDHCLMSIFLCELMLMNEMCHHSSELVGVIFINYQLYNYVSRPIYHNSVRRTYNYCVII